MDDLSDLIDCMDYGFHQSLSRAMMMRSDALKQTRKSEQQDIDLMEKVLGALDSRWLILNCSKALTEEPFVADWTRRGSWRWWGSRKKFSKK